MVTIKDLHVSYDGAEMLHGVSAQFPEGKISVIIGPNGSGKSTAMKSIVRLVEADSGSICIAGKAISELSQKELAQTVAYLPQSRNVPDISVYNMVMHGRFPYLSYPRKYRKEDREMVDKALQWVDLKDLARRKLESLSGGQRQKAYMAMALAQDTDVVLMDEPTTYLDIKNQFELLERARSLADSGKTVIMILHDMELVLHCADHVLLMDKGSVIASGSAAEVLRSEQVRQAFGVTPCFFEAEDGLHCYVRP